MRNSTAELTERKPGCGRGFARIRRPWLVVSFLAAVAAALFCLAASDTPEPGRAQCRVGQVQAVEKSFAGPDREQAPESQQVVRFDASRVLQLLFKAGNRYIPQLRTLNIFWFQLVMTALLAGIFLHKVRRLHPVILFRLQTVLIVSSPVRAGPRL